MTALSCYRIRDGSGGKDVTDSDQAVDLARWAGSSTKVFETERPFPARLYVVTGTDQSPDWLALLPGGFGPEVQVVKTHAPKALLIMR